MSAYRQAIALRDDHAVAHGNLGLALASQGQVADAIASLNRALQLQPNLPSANVNLAVLLANGPDAKLRNVTRALDHARKAAADRQNLWALGVVYYRAGMFSAAVQTLEEWLKLRKTSYRVRFFLAMAHEKLGHKEEAERYYDDACREVDRDAASLRRKQDNAYREELHRLRDEAAQLLGRRVDRRPG
jgi:tetratricopeptide (TPR) repeat protein